MGQLVPVDHDPFAPEATVPPGMSPGPMVAQPNMAGGTMVPLSPDAQRARRMIEVGGIRGNRSLEQAGQALLAADPTQEERKAQSTALGSASAKRQDQYIARELAGRKLLAALDMLYDNVEKVSDQDWKNGFGPFNMTPYTEHNTPSWAPWLTKRIGMTYPEAQAAYNPDNREYQSAWNAQNLANHNNHNALTTYIEAAGSSGSMSDARQAAFEKTIADYMKSTNKDEAKKVLRDAKLYYANQFGLTPEQALDPGLRPLPPNAIPGTAGGEVPKGHATTAPRYTATNPKTGAKIESDDGMTWRPARGR